MYIYRLQYGKILLNIYFNFKIQNNKKLIMKKTMIQKKSLAICLMVETSTPLFS